MPILKNKKQKTYTIDLWLLQCDKQTLTNKKKIISVDLRDLNE